MGALQLLPSSVSQVWQGTRGIERARLAETSSAETSIECFDFWILPEVEPIDAGWKADFLCLPSTIRMMVVDPLPHHLSLSSSLIPAFLEHLLWLPVLLAALLALRRFRELGLAERTALIYGLSSLVMWALIDRVIGTAFRHRAESVAPLLIAGLAVRQLSQASKTATAQPT